MCLSPQKRLISCVTLSKGVVNSVNLNVRQIVEEALKNRASSVIMAHNHPSGNALPSRTDLNTTKLIADTLRGVGVSLLDHYIVADNDYISLRESHLM